MKSLNLKRIYKEYELDLLGVEGPHKQTISSYRFWYGHIKKNALFSSKHLWQTNFSLGKMKINLVFRENYQKKTSLKFKVNDLKLARKTRINKGKFINYIKNYNSNKMINELYIFKSSKKLGKNGSNNNTSIFLKKIHPKLLTINLNGDSLLKKDF